MRSAGSQSAETGRHDRAGKTGLRVSQPATDQGAPEVSRRSPCPVDIDAHSRSQSVDLLDRIGADGESPQIEIPGRPGRAPPGILALRCDHADFRYDLAVVKRRDADREAVSELEARDQVFAQRKPEPGIGKVHQ